jgi:hypothetical protein
MKLRKKGTLCLIHQALSDPDKALIRCEQLALGLIGFRVD